MCLVMAFSYRTIFMHRHYIRDITKPVVKWSIEKHFLNRTLCSGICYRRNIQKPFELNNVFVSYKNSRLYATQCPPEQPEEQHKKEPPKKEGMVQKLKSMYRDYWYVAVPVHFGTSALWFGGLYYTVKSGFDVIAVLESIGISETLITPLRDSKAGFIALTFALYKVISPLRYAVTIGGTTFAINKLTALGVIKPVPSKARLKEMYQERKDTFQDRKQHYQFQIKEKHTKMMDEMRKYKQQMKDKVKKT